MNKTVNILNIIRGTTVDGPGFRTSIYFAGCEHHCNGCHNPQSWDFQSGTPMTIDEIMEIVDEEDFDVTLIGGDPLYNPDFVTSLADRIHSSGHLIWLYTGFKWESILKNNKLAEAIKHIDVVVDSPYVSSLRDTDLLFRGSSNQRIINVAESLQSGTVCLWQRL